MTVRLRGGWFLVLSLLTACATDPDSGGGGGGGNDAEPDAADGQTGDVVAEDDPPTGQPDLPSADGSTDPAPTDDTGTPVEAFPSCVSTGSEVCGNGYDDNCDGRPDEGCGCAPQNATQPCYIGAASDLSAPATTCQAGTQTCRLEFWGECEEPVGPGEEICDDALDNDCDGAVDEDCTVEIGSPEAICPAPAEGPVLRDYTLTGQYQDANGSPMATASWSQTSWPPGHSHDIQSDGLEFAFFADVAGTYEFTLTVSNAAGESDSCQTSFVALTDDVLRIEMYWNPDHEGPADTSDVDLLLHRDATGDYAWYQTDDSCYWNNCATCDEPYDDDTQREVRCRDFLAGAPPDGHPAGDPWPSPVLSWFPGGVETDPRLDLDDVQGQGPENINIRRPNAGTYRVSAHYFDTEGSGNALTFVRILCNGAEIYASEGVTLTVEGNGDEYWLNDHWEVGDLTIAYDGSGVPTCTFDEFGGTGCHRICAFEDADEGGCAPESCE